MCQKLDLVLSNIEIHALKTRSAPLVGEDLYHPSLSMYLDGQIFKDKNRISSSFVYNYANGDFL